jgi:hypothetical protein
VPFAAFETSSRASPPAAGTVQMSPPETNAISLPSGAMAGSAEHGLRGALGTGLGHEQRGDDRQRETGNADHNPSGSGASLR